VKLLKEELELCKVRGSYVGYAVKVMDENKVFVKIPHKGKFIVDIDKNIDIKDLKPNCRIALRHKTYTIHKILSNKVCICVFVI